LAVLDPIKQMQTMPAFLWNKHRVLVSHRGSLNRERFWSRLLSASS
jgi:hypothetical protein